MSADTLRHTHHTPPSTYHHTRHEQRRRTIFRSAGRVLWLTLGMCLGGLLWASMFQLPEDDTRHSAAGPFTFVKNADAHEERGEEASARRKRPSGTPAPVPPYPPTDHDLRGHHLFGIPLDPMLPVYQPSPPSSTSTPGLPQEPRMPSASASASVGAAAAAAPSTSPLSPSSSSSSSSLSPSSSSATGTAKHTKRKRRMMWPFGSSTTTTTTRPKHGSVRQTDAVTTASASEAVDIDFTLVTIASSDRLWLVSHICKRWTGPIIVAVTTHGMTAERQAHMRGLYTSECPRVHMELMEHVPGWTEEMWADPNKFPINILRNHAISLVNTTHYVMADVDFWPNHGLYTHLRRISGSGAIGASVVGGGVTGSGGGGEGAQGNSGTSSGGGGGGGEVEATGGGDGGGDTNTQHTHTDTNRARGTAQLRSRHTTGATAFNVSLNESDGSSSSSSESSDESARALFMDPLSAFVVPAFELHAPKHATKPGSPRDMPRDVQALEACLGNKKCHVFQSVIAPRGHATTHSDKWIQIRHTTRPYAVRCFESNMYEPYLVLRKGHPTPAYAEAFTGYGKNKIQHIVHLRHRGFKFHILPQAFLVHFPHRTSDAYKSWYESRHVDGHRKDMTRMYERFIEWAEEEDAAKEGRVVPLCEQTADNPTKTAKPLASDPSASVLPPATTQSAAPRAPVAAAPAAAAAAASSSSSASPPSLPPEAEAAAAAATDDPGSSLPPPPPPGAVRAPAHTTAAPPPGLRPPSSATSNSNAAHTSGADQPPGTVVAVQ